MSRHKDNTMSIEAYPLHWPLEIERTPAHKRERARFSTQDSGYGRQSLTIHQAMRRLLEELDRFNGRWTTRVLVEDAIISSNVPVRLDGLPRSGVRMPEDPGVALYFTLDGKDLCFPCDAWDRVPDNIAAIAAHLGALRGIERWKVGEIGAMYTGYAQLPPPGEPSEWRKVLGAENLHCIDEVRAKFKRLRSQYHPDHRGDNDAFHIINKAWEQAQSELGSK